MSIKETAIAMRPFVDRCGIMSSAVYGGDATTVSHLYDMIRQIEYGEVTGEKAHRWVGWMQGVICCRGGATLEDMKEVNASTLGKE